MIPVTARQWKRGQFSTFFSIDHPAVPKPKHFLCCSSRFSGIRRLATTPPARRANSESNPKRGSFVCMLPYTSGDDIWSRDV
jgi:hypothetical protein